MDWLGAYFSKAMELGDQHGVNPLIFAGIYVGAIPFFFASVYWTVWNHRKKQSLVLPVMFTGFFFCSAYLYVVVFGRDLPWYVYAVVIGVAGAGAVRLYRQVRARLSAQS